MDMQGDALDQTVASFFAKSGTDATRQQCDDLAIKIAGEPVIPVPVQGLCSYTVVAGSKQADIFQFRSPQEDLVQPKLLELIKKVHGNLVPTAIDRGTVGNTSPLLVYIMQKLPGKTHLEVRLDGASPSRLPAKDEIIQLNTIVDLAGRFVAELKNAQTLSASDVQSLREKYEKKLDILSANLPEPFRGMAMDVHNRLDSLFTEWPMTLSHEDLTEKNVLVDPSTGHLTGIIDWVDAMIAPFGVGLYGVESFMGIMEDDGWRYFSNVERMRVIFEGPIQNAMADILPKIPLGVAGSKLSLAKKLGVLLHYGFVFYDGQVRAVKEGDANIQYLKAFLG